MSVFDNKGVYELTKIFSVAVIQIAATLSTFYLLSHFSKELDSSSFEALTIYLSISSFLLMPGFLGQAMYSIKYFSKDQPDVSLVGVSNTIALLGAVLVSIIVCTVLTIRTDQLNESFFYVLLCCITFCSLQFSRYRLLSSGYKAFSVFMVSFAPSIGVIVCAKFYAFLWYEAYLISQLICLAVVVLCLEKKNKQKNIFRLSWLNRINLKQFDVVASFSFFKTAIYQSVAKFGDLVAVSVFLPVEVAAIYLVASRIAKAPELLLNSVSLNYIRKFSNLAMEGQHHQVRILFYKCQGVLFVMMLVFILAIFVSYEYIVNIFFGLLEGQGYLVALLLSATFVNVITGPAGQLLNIIGKHRQVESISKYSGLLGGLVICLCATTNSELILAAAAFAVSTIKNGAFLYTLHNNLERIK